MMIEVMAMGCRQVVRHLVLVQTFRGSNPCTPVKFTFLDTSARVDLPMLWLIVMLVKGITTV
jgi:hypothetical protein